MEGIFCHTVSSISMWLCGKGPIWVSSVGWVVTSGPGNFIFLELFYNDV